MLFLFAQTKFGDPNRSSFVNLSTCMVQYGSVPQPIQYDNSLWTCLIFIWVQNTGYRIYMGTFLWVQNSKLAFTMSLNAPIYTNKFVKRLVRNLKS